MIRAIAKMQILLADPACRQRYCQIITPKALEDFADVLLLAEQVRQPL